MGTKTETSTDVREIIINLHKKSVSQCKIHRIIKRSHMNVQTIIRNYKQWRSVENNSRSGRPANLSVRKKHPIFTKTNHRITAAHLGTEIEEATDIIFIQLQYGESYKIMTFKTE